MVNRLACLSVPMLLLLQASVAPASAQSEIGENDFRISVSFPQDVRRPAVAYNSTDDEYIVVWSAVQSHGSSCPLFPSFFVREIWAQLIDGTTGALTGGAVRVSASCDPLRDGADQADVAYNSTENEYLVVWRDDDDDTLVADEFEVFGQLLSNSLAPVGVDDFRISDLGGTGNANFDARSSAVAYNSVNNEYLVVWYGDDNVGDLVDDELEIFGQRLDKDGTAQGANDFRISDMGAAGTTLSRALSPAVTFNSVDNEYLVVWSGDDHVASRGGVSSTEFEIYGQRLNQNGIAQGTNDFRISDMGGTGNASFDGSTPAVAHNSVNNEYLVVWTGSDDVGGLSAGELEIFGQRLDESGTEQGTNDFRISDMGGTGDNEFLAFFSPAVIHDVMNNEYLVVWFGDDSIGGLVDEEFEVFGQRLSQNGTEQGNNDFRISDMGDTGNASFDAWDPAVAYNATTRQVLLVWWGDDNVGGLLDNGFEIFGQRLELPLFVDGFELGNTSGWSASVP